MNEITSPPVLIKGSKWNIADWVVSYLPLHECYVEPFCGGASVLLHKDPSPIDVMNDLNGDVVNFFRVLREQTDAFMRAITLTPYSREEVRLSHEICDDPLERARRFYVQAKQKFGGISKGHENSWRYKKTDFKNPLHQWLQQDHLIATVERLRDVYIESDTALNTIVRFDAPDTLFYCDPPYVAETRTEENYANEMTDADHIALSETLHQIKGMALISGYDCPLYRDLYADWKMVTKQAYTIKRIGRTECLWISPSAQAKQAQRRLL